MEGLLGDLSLSQAPAKEFPPVLDASAGSWTRSEAASASQTGKSGDAPGRRPTASLQPRAAL